MRPETAVMELSKIGFRFRLDGKAVKVRFEGDHKPDPAAVSTLLDVVSQHKEDVRYFLRCHCTKCGGSCFIPDYEGKPLCLGCDWAALVKLYPAMAGVKH
jgi:hypothetical protein